MFASKFNNFKIDELKESGNKYIELIESLTQNQNLNLKSKNEETGKLMVMIFYMFVYHMKINLLIFIKIIKKIKKIYII